MVDLALLQSISYMAGALGVCVAAIYYLIILRSNNKTRQADILHRHAQINASKDFMDAWADVVTQQNFLSYEEWRHNYGPYKSPPTPSHGGSILRDPYWTPPRARS